MFTLKPATPRSVHVSLVLPRPWKQFEGLELQTHGQSSPLKRSLQGLLPLALLQAQDQWSSKIKEIETNQGHLILQEERCQPPTKGMISAFV